MSSNVVQLIVPVFSVVAIGMMSGLMLASGLAGYADRALPETSWTLRFQREDALFAKVMPPFFLVSLFSLAASSFLAAGNSRTLFGAAAVLTVGIIAITLALQVPINKTVQSWTAGAAPTNWTALRDRWLRNHLVRTIVTATAFVCATIAIVGSR
jgi:uncharacterized membrane protein